MKQILLLTMSLVFTLAFTPVSRAESETPSDKLMVPKARYITGGVLASTIGLGIGHVVEDRYFDKGWIFTTTEVAGIALLAGANCSSHRHTDAANEGKHSDDGDCDNPGQAVLGVAVWLGFHAWEIVDIWAGARPYSKEEPTTSAMLLPSENGPVLALTYKF